MFLSSVRLGEAMEMCLWQFRRKGLQALSTQVGSNQTVKKRSHTERFHVCTETPLSVITALMFHLFVYTMAGYVSSH